MFRNIGQESLIQRGKSPFYKDLTSLYQDSINAVRELSEPSHGTVLLALKSIKFRERLKALVLKHMGVPLSYVTIHESSSLNLMCTMQLTKEAVKSDTTYGSILETINRMYDDRKGYIEPKDRPNPMPVKYGFVAFTSLWFFKDASSASYFTAEELAAGTLHEFGHVDHFIRSSMRIYGRTQDASDLVDYLHHKPDPDVIRDLIVTIKKSLPKDKHLEKVLEITQEYFRTSNSQDDPQYLEALNTLAAIVMAQNAALQLFDYEQVVGGGRVRVRSHSQLVDAERSADDFAARHGAYASLTSLTGKLHATADKDAYLILKQIMWDGPALVFGSCLYFLSVFNFNAEVVSNGYDPLLKRMQLIVETAKHAFSNTDLPIEVRMDIHNQITQADTYIRQYHSARNRALRANFFKWFQTIGRLGRIVKSPFEDRLSQDYGRLQDATRSLSRHPLYYLKDKHT